MNFERYYFTLIQSLNYICTLGGKNTKVMLLNSKVEIPQDLLTLAELTICEDAISKIIITLRF
jgi:hypothetical protein